MAVTIDGTTGVAGSGNLTFTGTGNRITGDFSNATVANRVLLQTSTANSNTVVEAIPSGTSQSASLTVSSSSTDPANTSTLLMNVNGTSAVSSIQASARGTGTYLPLAFYTNANERMRIDTSGNVGIGTTTPSASAKLTVAGNVSAADGAGFGWAGLTSYVGGSSASNFVNFVTASTERARIDSSGNLQVGGSTVANTVGYVNSRTNTRAWVRWVGSTGAVTASYNVSSVTRNSTGNYTVNFTTSLADANYAPIGMTAGAATYGSFGAYMQQTSAPTAASCAITTLSNSGVAVDCIANQLVIFGN